MADQITRRTITTPHRYALVAAAEVITSKSMRRPHTEERVLPWQTRSWDHFDNTGEFEFAVTWLANGMSRVNLCAARAPIDPGDEPVALRADTENLTAVERRTMELVEFIGGGPVGQGQLLSGFGQHLSIAGFGWLLAEPPLDDLDSDVYATWGVYAQDVIRFVGSGDSQTIEIQEKEHKWRQLHPNHLLVRCWRKHPRRPWEPHAPVRASLGVLDVLRMLTQHVNATGLSRLAGAGVWAIPSEAEFPMPPLTDDQDPESVTAQMRFDYWWEQFTQAMMTPISDPESAAAVVPYTISIPGEFIAAMKEGYLTFSTPFDERIQELFNLFIGRFATAQDLPREVLLGLADSNHWSAWKIGDEAVTLHIEPAAEIACAALTDGYLIPALKAEGLDPSSVMVWYDTSDLSTPPDKSGNATIGHERILISDSAARRELGFGDEDEPDEEEFRRRLFVDIAKAAPALAPSMLAAAGYLTEGEASAVDVTRAPGGNGSEPRSSQEQEQPPEREEAAVMLAYLDGVAHRAMERAGSRLRLKVGSTIDGGPQAMQCDDLSALHTVYDPTVYADLDYLLDGAFGRVPEIAVRLGVDSSSLLAAMNAYCRALLAAQHEHTLERLAAAFGV